MRTRRVQSSGKNSLKRDLQFHYRGQKVHVSPAKKKKKKRKVNRISQRQRETYLTSGTAPITITPSKATTRVDKIFERIFFKVWLVSHSRLPLDERFLYATHRYTHIHTEIL